MRKPVAFAAALLLLSMPAAHLSRAHRAAPQAKPVPADEDREKLLATGKKIFVERCAKCHDEHGDKPLKSGPPLSQRGLSDDEIARLAGGRLKNAPEEEKRAVALYISSFMKLK